MENPNQYLYPYENGLYNGITHIIRYVIHKKIHSINNADILDRAPKII